MELLARLKLIAQEFSDQDDNFLNGHLEMAGDLISKSIPNPFRDELIAYLAAHRIDQSLKRQGASGQVSSVKEGSLSVSYYTGDAKSEYDFSSYGRTYAQLVKQYSITACTRMSL